MKLATFCSWAVRAVFCGTEKYMLVCFFMLSWEVELEKETVNLAPKYTL